MKKQTRPTFVDLFAGCGGLSLGLAQANWQGIFAIEKADDAFKTFKENLLEGPSETRFSWPTWIPEQAHSIDDVLSTYREKLIGLRGTIDLITGGPPCQGFSFAGRRVESDPRNMLFEKYVQFVDHVRPRALVLENVPGMRIAHGSEEEAARKVIGAKPESFFAKLVKALHDIGYIAEGRILDASQFGVPQRRLRLIVVGIERTLSESLPQGISSAFELIDESRKEQLRNLQLSEQVSVRDAISDLAISDRPLVPCDDPASPKGFETPCYVGPTTIYQRLMHSGCENEPMDSMRLAKHTKTVRDRFELILKECPKGTKLSERDRERFGLLKHRTWPLAADQPSATVTTLPDDLLHYSEPRILTVREYARLQSFPDWYKFRGKYTTGGEMRKKDCPRYTQIGNAVPPLLAKAIGVGMVRTLRLIEERTRGALHANAINQTLEEAGSLV